mmetsp:Transcript_42646/g.91476  ORF Transcript_42646/g.91476 Transcript_42646/m.91476 type:complete len:217 (+) Transcript_42646:99-749(+)|eukprot:CAMPEP_0206465050 /NCGR_PEP_ID=MMETSP0324_2-20121206/27589_1 /ASSEMBLY_ACC=CAM_ASM_000836 /TAXON_ID=2866 /ORGANISM="Crypthecodinium cohnii, Strain Seligo" /LENGTH=216 /DNA_ID=CAMNT_0053937815 /DNA_START=92 /DNA_END=742 /DNA_ORIENTATION=-
MAPTGWTTFVLALGLTCLGHASAGETQLDPESFFGKQYYFLSDGTCYQVWAGARMAEGQPKIGDTPATCKAHWEEAYDLGNFDGFRNEDGQHFSGGSRMGCSSWLKVFGDDSLTEVSGEVTVSGKCDRHVTLKGPTKAFGENPKVWELETEVSDKYEESAPSLRSQMGQSSRGPIIELPNLGLILALGAILCSVALVVRSILKKRRTVPLDPDAAE